MVSHHAINYSEASYAVAVRPTISICKQVAVSMPACSFCGCSAWSTGRGVKH